VGSTAFVAGGILVFTTLRAVAKDAQGPIRARSANNQFVAQQSSSRNSKEMRVKGRSSVANPYGLK
jgi:hypothetical protein